MSTGNAGRFCKALFAASIYQLISEARFWHPGNSLQELLAFLDLLFSKLLFPCTYFFFFLNTVFFPLVIFIFTWE